MTHIKIYQSSKNPLQSGDFKKKKWIIEKKEIVPTKRDSVMGWISSSNTETQVLLSFSSLEKAVEYAKENDFEYSVILPSKNTIKPKNYADNFLSNP